MSFLDDDSYSGFELLGSQELRKSFEVVPVDTLFKFKVLNSDLNKKFKYNIVKGTPLPCQKVVGGRCRTFELNPFNILVIIVGYEIHFDAFLEPSMVGYDCWSEAEKNGIIWIFRVQDVGQINKTQECIEDYSICFCRFILLYFISI